MKFLNPGLLLLLTSLLLAQAASAEEGLEGRDRASSEAVESLEAYAAYKMAQYGKARNIWLSLAERNNPSAMINLANMAEQGQGIPKNPEEATNWLRKAAELGDVRGQLQLGLAYEKGLGVERDPVTASQWFRKAAMQGDAIAQFNLGVMLATNYGKGPETVTEEQNNEAIEWLTRSAKQDHPDAKAMVKMLKQKINNMYIK